MGRRKGHGWVNGLQSWERGGERGESRAGLVLEGPESKLCMYLPPLQSQCFQCWGSGFSPRIPLPWSGSAGPRLPAWLLTG